MPDDPEFRILGFTPLDTRSPTAQRFPLAATFQSLGAGLPFDARAGLGLLGGAVDVLPTLGQMAGATGGGLLGAAVGAPGGPVGVGAGAILGAGAGGGLGRSVARGAHDVALRVARPALGPVGQALIPSSGTARDMAANAAGEFKTGAIEGALQETGWQGLKRVAPLALRLARGGAGRLPGPAEIKAAEDAMLAASQEAKNARTLAEMQPTQIATQMRVNTAGQPIVKTPPALLDASGREIEKLADVQLTRPSAAMQRATEQAEARTVAERAGLLERAAPVTPPGQVSPIVPRPAAPGPSLLRRLAQWGALGATGAAGAKAVDALLDAWGGGGQ